MIVVPSTSFSQKKNIFPIWTFHDDSTNIHGVSVGLWSFSREPRNTNTNGVKIELIGAGILYGLGPRSPVAESEREFNEIDSSGFSERINGISISPLGASCNCQTNGIAISGWGQYNQQVNGISVNMFYNWAQIHNGIQFGFFLTQSFKMNGVQISAFNWATETNGAQIGLYNRSESGKVFQIGLWNVNEKRKLPIINWNFKSTKH